MKKLIVFDMDGTIANLYGVENWLEDLRAYNTRPYDIAEPLVDMSNLKDALMKLKSKGYKVAVTSWLSKCSTKEYDNKVRASKKAWLDKYGFPYDELHLVKYGTTKLDCTRGKAEMQILFDDNEKVRNGWNGGMAFDEKNIIKNLLTIGKLDDTMFI